MKRTRAQAVAPPTVAKPKRAPEPESDDETYDFNNIVEGDSDDNFEDGDLEDGNASEGDSDGIGWEEVPSDGDIHSEDEDEDEEEDGEEEDGEDGSAGSPEDEEDDEEFASSGDDDEDEEDEFGLSDDSDSPNRGESKAVRVLRKKPLPEIDPVYESDDSDEETINTTGNVPREWYEDFPHIGYDVEGKKIMKGSKGDKLDAFLSAMDDPNAWRSVYDALEDKDVVLSAEDLELLNRIKANKLPEADYDPYEPTVEWFTSQTMVTPLSAAPEPKRRFIPSKTEARRILYIARAIQKGWIVPGKKTTSKPKYYSVWDDADEPREDHPMHIPAPKMALPDNAESYNPPAEYLLTKEEEEEWKKTDAEDRPTNFIPKKYPNLRSVPGYDRFIQERFDRCLDLYLCPRMVKKKVNIDPESLIPKLPSPKDLRPFPSALAIVYKGHTGRVRSISVDPTGQWLASGSDDQTVRVWEVATGRCLKSWTVGETVQSVSWNPNKALSLLAVAAQSRVILFNPELASTVTNFATDQLITQVWSNDPAKSASEWAKPTDAEFKDGHRVHITFAKNVTYLTWHRKGDYFATVSPDAASTAVLVHQLSKRQTQNPFRKSKGLVQRVLFHPSKPFLFVATQRYVRVYNLLKQELAKKLQSGAKWISSMDIHPGGDNVIIGTYDKRVCWFDMDLSTKPYKTLRYHKFAVRQVSFHKRYPLFASCSDDGSVNIFHGMVYNDLMQNPLIVPVKTLRAHDVVDSLGALHCEFHPTQPWIFSCGSDTTIKLFS
ncbi:Ribosome biogenesis protein 1 [Borealophlyctis nickersoniae]|nr:Ribosome biogenesis protein 1 [Borealophlyctis nickersoniae]